MTSCIIVFLFTCVSVIFFYAMGATMHEKDLSRNFKNDGNAKSWFFEIKCDHGGVK